MPDAFSLAADELDETADVSGILKYYDDPAGFAREAIAWKPGRSLAPYQADVLGEIPRRKRVSVRGPHGLGKSSVSALAVLWFCLTRDAAGRDWKCVTTAGGYRQLTHFLWPEIRKWSRLVRWDFLGIPPMREGHELLILSMKLRHGEAIAAASSKPDKIEGAHGDSVMYVFDESKSISADTFDAAEGAFSGASEDEDLEAFALAMSTPGEPNGRFYDIHRKAPGLDDWWTRHVTLEEAIAAGRVSREWAERRLLQWTADTAVYNNRVLGEFWSSDEDGVIPLSWYEAAVERWHAWEDAGKPEQGGPHILGVDVARSGRDKTIIALRDAWVIRELRESARENTMSTTGRVAGILDADPKATAIVDVIGIGAGVYDKLRESGHRAEPFNASAGTRRKDASNEFGFVNCLTGDTRVLPVGRLLRVYRSRYDGPLFRVKTAGGDEFTATANHNVLTPRGWVPVQSLGVGDELCDSGRRERMPLADPDVGDVPASIGEIYRAAHRSRGAERVAAAEVNFHGDSPVGDVDVVEVHGNLFPVRPPERQEREDPEFVGLLHGLGGLAGDSGAADGGGGLGLEFGQPDKDLPPLAPPGRAAPVVCLGEPHGHEPVRLDRAPYRNVPLGKDACEPFVGYPELAEKFLAGDSGDVTRSDHVRVGLGVGESERLSASAWSDAVLSQDSADDITVNAEMLGKCADGFAGVVAREQVATVDVLHDGEAHRVGPVPWLDAAFAEDLVHGGPVSPETLGERYRRLSGEVPLDQVASIEVAPPALHVDPFVYTLETSTGAYRTSRIVHRNCRSAAWWNLRELLDLSRGAEVALPPDDELVGDLTAPHWRITSGAKIQVESKDDIRKRIGRSTDRADAVVQALWGSGVSWAEAYGMTECPSCERLYPEGAQACPSCGQAAPERAPEPEAAAEPERSPEAGLKETQPHNPWAEVYGKRGGR